MPEKAESDQSTKKAAELSRLQRLKAMHGELYAPAMPPLDCGAHVLAHFWAAGPTVGGEQLTHGELRSFQKNTGIGLSEWEASTLRQMSGAYLEEMHRATKRDCPAPWQDSVEALTLNAADVRDSIRALAKL